MMVCRSYLLESLYRINITSDSLGPTSILSLYLGPPSILESQIDRMPVIELATNPLSQFLYVLISKGEFQLKVSFFVFMDGNRVKEMLGFSNTKSGIYTQLLTTNRIIAAMLYNKSGLKPL